MTEENEVRSGSKRIFYLKALLLILIPAILARVLYIAYSENVTDITVSPVFTELLRYSSLAMTCIMCGAAYAAITSAVYRRSTASGIVVLLIFSTVFLCDCAVRFMSDYIGGELRYREIFAIITLLTEFFAQAAMAMCAWMISVAFHHLHSLNPAKRSYFAMPAAMASSVIRFAVPFIRWFATTLSFLNEVEWIPTSAEIASVFSDLASILIFYGAVTFISVRVVLHFLIKPSRK